MIDNLNSALNFIPVKLSRNDLNHVIDPANTAMTNRAGLKYELEIQVPEFDGSASFVALHRSRLKEKPPYQVGASTIFEGAAVCYNKRNGKIDNLLKLQKPDFAMLEPKMTTTQTLQYKLREIVTGGTPAVAIDITRPVCWAAKAGLNEVDYLSYGDSLFSSFQNENRRFLTSQPDRKIISKNQTEFLSFLMNINPMSAAVRLRIECFSDFSGMGVPLTYQTLVSPIFMGVAMFPINVNNLGLPALCSYFKVWLSDQDNARISEVRTYFIDPLEKKQERFLLYSNSLGGWDTLRMTGDASETTKVSQGVLAKDKSSYGTQNEELLKVISTDGDREILISTGYFQKDLKLNLASLEEILVSENIFLETEKGHKQLKRLTNSLVVSEDEFGNVSRTMQFMFVDPVKNFSSLPAADIPTPRPIGWAAFGNQIHVLDGFGKRTGYKKTESLIKKYLDDNSNYRPLTIKANTVGTEGYIGSYFDNTVVIGSTPFPSAAINSFTTFLREGCAVGFEGGPAPINIAAATYGGEQAGDGDTLAQAAASALNTQANANANGPCNVLGPNYTANVWPNHWYYRVKDPAKMSIWFHDDGTGPYNAGNDEEVQSLTGPYIYGLDTNGLNFPVSGPPAYLGWKIQGRGYVAGQAKTLKFYVNNVLKYSRAMVIEPDGTFKFTAFYGGYTNGHYAGNGELMFWEVV